METNTDPQQPQREALAPAAGSALAWGDPLEIQTGEMDDPLRHRFVIAIGGNGDIYLQVTPNNKRTSPPVHIVTHGGHNSQMPGVTRALFELYRELWGHHTQNALAEQPPINGTTDNRNGQ